MKLSWDEIKEYGYGLLGLHPDTLFALSVQEFVDMVDAKLTFKLKEKDDQLEWASWFVANLMLSGGNMKKGTKPQKLAKGLYVPLEDRMKEAEGKKDNHLTEEELLNKRNELLKKFNIQ